MTVDDIKIGVVGKILAGDDLGCWLRIDDDSSNTGGFLVHVSKDSGFMDSGDDWVESYDVLREYFEESNWEIDWASE